MCLGFGLTGVRAFYEIQTDNARIIELGMQYTQTVTVCAFGLMLQNITERLLSSTGKTNLCMVILTSGALVNIVLDPVLIFGYLGFPALGMKGAAIATVAGQCVAGVTGLFLNIKYNREVCLQAKSFLPDFSLIREIMMIAIPTTLTLSVSSILIFSMNKVLAGLSLAAPAVYIIYNRVRSFVALPIWGIRNTIISIIAYNMGADKKGRVRKTISIALKASALIALCGTVLYEAIPGLLLSVFSASEEMLSIGIPAFRIIGTSLVISGMAIMMSGIFQAMKASGKAFWVSIVQAVSLAGSAALLAFTRNITLVWISFPISKALTFLLCLFYLHGLYKKNF